MARLEPLVEARAEAMDAGVVVRVADLRVAGSVDVPRDAPRAASRDWWFVGSDGWFLA